MYQMFVSACASTALALSAPALAGVSPMSTLYEVIDLGPNVGGGSPSINGVGTVALSSNPQGVPPPAQTWSNGAFTNYAGISNPLNSINNLGDLVGGFGSISGTFVYVNGQSLNLNAATGLSRTKGVDINDSRQIVLQTTLSNPRAFVYDANSGTTTNLGTLGGSSPFVIPSAINSSSHVVGYSRRSDTSRTRAWIWRGLALAELAPTSFTSVDTFAYDINDSGIAVGSIDTLTPAVFSAGSAQALQTPPASDACSILAINNDAFKVGYYRRTIGGFRAGFWNDAGLFHNLNELSIAGEEAWTFEAATDVNDDGWIVGFGTLNGASRSFLLRPIPAPGTFVGVLLVGVIWTGRRQRSS